jgi:hypothetical protein
MGRNKRTKVELKGDVATLPPTPKMLFFPLNQTTPLEVYPRLSPGQSPTSANNTTVYIVHLLCTLDLNQK